MAWPNPFRRRTENTVYCWGYTFEWTPEHLTTEQTAPLKQTYDVLGEECLARLNAISPPKSGVLPRNNSQHRQVAPDPTKESDEEKKEGLPLPQRDLYALLKEQHASDPKLTQLWEEVNTVPAWVDWAQIQRGQDVFYRYGGPALTGLTFQSLLGGMGAARVVETLARTGGFNTKVARRRLFETTQHILQCTKSLESLQPGGEGHASSIRVRLLHAAVRQRILSLAKARPSYYDVSKHGVPINDLDQIATISTFCATLIWLSFPRQGIFLRAQEKEDYVALWRYIGYLLGTPTDHFATPEKAKAIMETLLATEVQPSDMSKVLSNNIIHALERAPPTYVSADMLIASARWLNGNELADALGLPQVSFYYWALMAGQCLFFISLCYSYRSIPYLDTRKVARLKTVFWKIIVEAKFGLAGVETLFEFKYVPEYDTVTDMGLGEEIKVRERSIELRNLRSLCMGVGVLALVTWASWRVTRAVVGLVW